MENKLLTNQGAILKFQQAIATGPTTEKVLALLLDGGSLFNLPTVVVGSQYAAWESWRTTLKSDEGYWTTLKTADDSASKDAQKAKKEKDVYAKRVLADDAAIKAITVFHDWVKANVTDKWKAKAAADGTTEALTKFEVPAEHYTHQEELYIHSYLKATEMQAATLAELDLKDAKNAATKERLEKLVTGIKKYVEVAKTNVKAAYDAVVAKEAEDKGGSLTWLWVVIGVVALALTVFFVWKCYCKKDEKTD